MGQIIIHNNFGAINFFENNSNKQEASQKKEPVGEDVIPSSIPPDFFCVSARFPEQNIRERLAAELSQATTKIDYCRGLYRLQHMGCINIDQYASDAQRAIKLNLFQSRFNLSPSDFCKARAPK